MNGVPQRQIKEGYWKPVLEHPAEHTQNPENYDRSSVISMDEKREKAGEPRADVCRHCGTEFVVRSPFCRMCGWRCENYEADELVTAPALDIRFLRRKLNVSTAGLICFIVGVICLGAAIAVGFLFSAATLVDWQAIQIWRVEWLLATIAALLAGILLNRRS